MQAPHTPFTLPWPGRRRLGRQSSESDGAQAASRKTRGGWTRPRIRLPCPRLPSLGPRALAGLTACLLVLAPGLLAAEAIVWAYDARLTDDARVRATAGLDSVTGLVDAERTRALNNADLAGVRLGPTISQGVSPDDLVKATGELRAALRASLVAPLGGDGKTLASDPASNLPFGNTWEAKQALTGKSVVVLQERMPGFAVQAAAPLRVNGEIVPGAVMVAQNLDDGFLNTSLRLTGLDVALIQNGRLVAASRGIRRSFSFATAADQNVDPELVASGPDRFKRARLGNEAFLLAGRTVSNGPREIGVLLVGPSAETVSDAVRWARLLTYGGALAGALLAGLLGVRLGAWQVRRVTALTGRVRSLAVPDAGARVIAARPSGGGPWSVLDAAIADTTAALVRRADEQRLRAARLEAVLGSLAEGVIVADEQRRVIFANPVARQLLHLPAGPTDSLPLLGDSLAAGSAASERVIRSYSASVLSSSGDDLGFVTVLRDATHEQEVERARSEMLGVVSHELQTPLTAIKGALELVVEEDEGRLSRVQRRFLNTIDRNCARMIGLVGDLLDLSRMDAGRLSLDSRPLDAQSVVLGSVSALSNLFEQRRQAVRVTVPEGVPPILGDRRRVEQILTNLLSNAAKYTPEGGTIEVMAAAENGHVRLAVADSGPGIPEAERELVFDRFYRGKDAGRRGEAGSGLGLAIVKSLVELHGGTVRAEAPADGSVAHGARFVVDLPRAADDD
ncbi:MAG: HAMP domain-containing histidine kinase [Chloroflexi bacterium]|nr:HAMP domain-containing histidine kinase [Chloroflexota bacterium]